jgi:putative endonuclease
MDAGRAGGRRGEEAAARHLIRRGWRILARNWRGGGGEIDLVAERRGLVAICEVKRRGRAEALEEPLTAAQRNRIVRAAAAFLGGRADLGAAEVRFDLLLVGPGRSRVRHLPGAFDAPARGYGSKRRSVG